MGAKLKPCPFCGSTDLLPSFYAGNDEIELGVACDSCNAEGPTVTFPKEADRTEAIKRAHAAWNERK